MTGLAEIEIWPSRQHIWLLAAAHIAILSWVLCLGWDGIYIPVAVFLVVCSGIWSWYRWRRGGMSLRCLDHAWIIGRNGREMEFVLEPDLFISPWCVVVTGMANGRRVSIPVFSDSLKPGRWRQLRALLVSESPVTR